MDSPVVKKRVAKDDAYVVKLNDVLGREIRRAFGEFLEQWRLGPNSLDRHGDTASLTIDPKEKGWKRRRKPTDPPAS